MKLVFCEECLYFDYNRSNNGFVCRNPFNFRVDTTEDHDWRSRNIRNIEVFDESPMVLNRDNSCQHYKSRDYYEGTG